MAHSQHVRLQAETDPLIRAFEEASEALKDGDDTTPRHADSTGMQIALACLQRGCACFVMFFHLHDVSQPMQRQRLCSLVSADMHSSSFLQNADSALLSTKAFKPHNKRAVEASALQ